MLAGKGEDEDRAIYQNNNLVILSTFHVGFY